jgi:hypothetical protein
MSTLFKLESCRNLSLVIVALGLIAGADVTAMGKKPAAETAPVSAPSTNKHTVPDVSAGSFQQGIELGNRNGDLIVQRLRARTVDVYGCAATDDLEAALVSVTRRLRPPLSQDDQLVRGFFRGYSKAIARGIRDVRDECDHHAHEQGDFAGQFAGALLCQVSTLSVEFATSLEVTGLYDGWSGGSNQVIEQCITAAQVTLKECSDQVDLVKELSLTVTSSCSDSI